MAAPNPPSPPPPGGQLPVAAGVAARRDRRSGAGRVRGAAEVGLDAFEQGARPDAGEGAGAPPLKRRIVLRLTEAGAGQAASSGTAPIGPVAEAVARAVRDVEEPKGQQVEAAEVPMQVDSDLAQEIEAARFAICVESDDWIVQEQTGPQLRERSGRFLLPIDSQKSKKGMPWQPLAIKNGSKDLLRRIPAQRLREVLEVNPASGSGLCLLEELVRAGLPGPVNVLLTSLKSANLLQVQQWGVRLQRRCIEWNQTDVLAALLQHFDPDDKTLELALRPRISPSYVRLLSSLQSRGIRLPETWLRGQQTQIFDIVGGALISFEERGKEDFNEHLVVCLWGWLWPQVKTTVLANRPICHAGLTCWLAALPSADTLNSALNLLREWRAGSPEDPFQLDWRTLFTGLMGIERAAVALRHLAKAKIPHQKVLPVAAVRQALQRLKEARPSSVSRDAAPAFDRLWTPETTAAFDLQDPEVQQLMRELADCLVKSDHRNSVLCGPVVWVSEVLRLLAPEDRLELLRQQGKRYPGSPLRFLQGMPESTGRPENRSSPSARAWRSRLEMLAPLLQLGSENASGEARLADLWADFSWDRYFERYGLEPLKLHQLPGSIQQRGSAGASASSQRIAAEEASPSLAVLLMDQLQSVHWRESGWTRMLAEQLRPLILGSPALPAGWEPHHREVFDAVLQELDLPAQAEIWNALFQEWGLEPLEGCGCATREAVQAELRRARSKNRPSRWPLMPRILVEFMVRDLPGNTPYDAIKINLLQEIETAFADALRAAQLLEGPEQQTAQADARAQARTLLRMILMQGTSPGFSEALVQQVRLGSSPWRRVLLESMVAHHMVPEEVDLRPWLLAEGMTEAWSALHASGMAMGRPLERALNDLVSASRLEGALERLTEWASATFAGELSQPATIRRLVESHPQERDEALCDLLMRTQALQLLEPSLEDPARAAELLEACDSCFRGGFLRTAMSLYHTGARRAADFFAQGVLLAHIIRAADAGMQDCHQAALAWLRDDARRDSLRQECHVDPQVRMELYQAVGNLRPGPQAASLMEAYVRAFDDHHLLQGVVPGALSQRLLMSLEAAGHPLERGLALIQEHRLPLATSSISRKLPSGGVVVHASLAASRIRKVRALDRVPEHRGLVDLVLPPDDMNAALDMVFGALGTDDPELLDWAFNRLGDRVDRLHFELSAPHQLPLPPIPSNVWALLKIASTWRIPSERLLAHLRSVQGRAPRLFERPAGPWRQLLQEMTGGLQFLLARAQMGTYRHESVLQAEAVVMDKELASRFLSRPMIVDSWSDEQMLQLLLSALPLEPANRPALPACLRALLMSGRWSAFQALLSELPSPATWLEQDQRGLIVVAAHAGMTTLFDRVPELRQVTLEPERLLRLIINATTAPFVRDWLSRRQDHELLLRPLLEQLVVLSKRLNPSGETGIESMELRTRAWLDLVVDLTAVGFDPAGVRAITVEIHQRLPRPSPLFSTTDSLAQALKEFLSYRHRSLQWHPKLYLECGQPLQNERAQLSAEEEKREILALDHALKRFWGELETRSLSQPHRSDLATQVESQRACWQTLFSSACPEEQPLQDSNAHFWQSLEGEAERLRGHIRGLLARCALVLNAREESLRGAQQWESEVAQLCDCSRCPTGTVGTLQHRLSALQIQENGGVRQTILAELHRIRETVLLGQRYRNTNDEAVRPLYTTPVTGGSLLNPNANVHQSQNLRHLLHARLGLTSEWQQRDAMSSTLLVGDSIRELPKDYWESRRLTHECLGLFEQDYQPDDVRWALIDPLRRRDEQGFVFRNEVLEVLAAAEEQAAASSAVPDMPPCFRGIQEHADARLWQRIATQLKGILQIPEGTRARLGLADLAAVGRLFERAGELLNAQSRSAEATRHPSVPPDPRSLAEMKAQVAKQLAAELTGAYPHIVHQVTIALRVALAAGVESSDAHAWTILHTTAAVLASDKSQKSQWRTGGIGEMSRFVTAIQEAFRASPDQSELRQTEAIWLAGYRELIAMCRRQELDKELSEGLFALKETSRSRVSAAGTITRLLQRLGILVTHGIEVGAADAWLDQEAKHQLQHPGDE